MEAHGGDDNVAKCHVLFCEPKVGAEHRLVCSALDCLAGGLSRKTSKENVNDASLQKRVCFQYLS